MYVDCDEMICSDGYIADGNGNCVPESDPCQTDNAILNSESIQSDLLAIWSGSGATDNNVPMNDRLEQGGWIVEIIGGYDIVFFPPTFIRAACGITPPANWTSLIPANTVGYVHSHPFYVGENTLGPCGEGGEESYSGGPSNDDYKFLTLAMNHLNDFTLKGFVIDGNKIYGYDFTHSAGVVEYDRCGY